MTNTFLTIENFSNIDLILPHIPMLRDNSFTCIINPQLVFYKDIFRELETSGIEHKEIKIDTKLSKHSLNYEFAFAHSVYQYLDTEFQLNDDIELVAFANSYLAKFFISKIQQGAIDKHFKLTIINAGSESVDHENLHLHEIYLSNCLLIEQQTERTFLPDFEQSCAKIQSSSNAKPLNIIITDEIGVIFAEELLDALYTRKKFIENKIFAPRKIETSRLRKLGNKLNNNKQKFNFQINEKYLVLGLPSTRTEFHSNLLELQGKHIFTIKPQNFQGKDDKISPTNLIMGRLNINEMLDFIESDFLKPRPNNKILPFICNVQEANISHKKCSIGLALLHYDRPHHLLRALRSVFSQTLQPSEIIICDDGSTSNDAINVLTSLENGKNEFLRSFKVLRNENLYLGALRNTAAQNINSDLVFFLDDDNVLRKDALEIFYSAQRNTGAEIVGSYQSGFITFEPDFLGKQILFSGVGIYSTAKKNWIADGNCLVKRDYFNKIGGNSEIHRIGADDHEFFIRSLFNGAKIEIISENLVACQQLKKRLRTNQYRAPGNKLRLGNAFKTNTTTFERSRDLSAKRPQLDEIIYQKLLIDQETITNILLFKLKSQLSKIAFMLPHNIRSSLGQNFLIRHFLNFLPKS
jgi:glycosyltransferase involved in cell wall biosynthesis